MTKRIEIEKLNQPKGNLTRHGLSMLPNAVLVDVALKLDEEKADLTDKLKKAQVVLEQLGK